MGNLYRSANRLFQKQIWLRIQSREMVEVICRDRIFYQFDKYENRAIRYTLGSDLRLNKQLELSLYYQIDTEKNVRIPDQQNILGLRLAIKLN